MSTNPSLPDFVLLEAPMQVDALSILVARPPAVIAISTELAALVPAQTQITAGGTIFTASSRQTGRLGMATEPNPGGGSGIGSLFINLIPGLVDTGGGGESGGGESGSGDTQTTLPGDDPGGGGGTDPGSDDGGGGGGGGPTDPPKIPTYNEIIKGDRPFQDYMNTNPSGRGAEVIETLTYVLGIHWPWPLIVPYRGPRDHMRFLSTLNQFEYCYSHLHALGNTCQSIVDSSEDDLVPSDSTYASIGYIRAQTAFLEQLRWQDNRYLAWY